MDSNTDDNTYNTKIKGSWARSVKAEFSSSSSVGENKHHLALVPRGKYIAKYSNNKEDENEKIREFFNSDENKLTIFVSIDICKSTRLKRTNHAWREIVTEFLNYRSGYLHNENLLKSIGDEMVYHYTVNNLIRIVDIIIDIFELNFRMHRVLTTLGKENIFVKSTVWVACIGQTHDPKAKNITLTVKGFDRIDFSGVNIDEGFRLSGKSEKNIVVVDPKIVMALALAKEKIENRYVGGLSFDIPPSFTNSIDNFMIQGNSKIDVVRKSYDKIKENFDKCISNIILDKYDSLKDVWYDEELVKEKYYPIFKYCDTEFSPEVAYILGERHNEFKIKKSDQPNNTEIIKMLSDAFNQADISQTMQQLLELMPFE